MSERDEHAEKVEAEPDASRGQNNLNELAATSPTAELNRRPSERHNDDFSKAESELFDEDADAGIEGLDELAAPAPDENPEEAAFHYHRSLEEERSLEQGRASTGEHQDQTTHRASSWEQEIIQLYTLSWLSFFAILGTLARLGVEWLTYYPNAPVTSNVLWANFGGSLILGFLQEDRALFAEQRHRDAFRSKASSSDPESSEPDVQESQRKAREEHLAMKKSIPLYIGLAVGFCGSFTSYSSFMRDLFFGLSNDLVGKASSIVARSPGWSVCSVLGVAIIHVAVSLAALVVGAHIATALLPLLCRIPETSGAARYVNFLAVFFGIGCWFGAVCLAIWPPQDRWRSIMFSLIFAPLGCILRYLLAIKLNRVFASFPLGTYVANMLGTVVLGLAYDIQHAPESIGGGILACQVLEGIMEGFSGCLTTVSTWVVELRSLRKHHAYTYGGVSIGVGFALMIMTIGSLHWTLGLSRAACAV